MKNKKILIISLCAVLIALVAAASVMLKRNSISKHSLKFLNTLAMNLVEFRCNDATNEWLSAMQGN